MGIEYNLLKDLATINTTATERVAVDRIIKTHISSAGFLVEYNSLVADIVSCYQVVIDNLQPLPAMIIDSVFKLLARLLNEVNEILAKDPEDACLVFRGGVAGLAAYIGLLQQPVAVLSCRQV